MKKILVLVMLCMAAFITPSQASTPQKIVFDNNTAAVLYVYITAMDPITLTYYQSNITAIPAGAATILNMHAGAIYPQVSWPVGGVPVAGSQFWGVEYYEYNPLGSCTPGPIVPSSGCNFISSSMDISSPTASSTCMETSGSACSTVSGGTIINGTVSAVYWRSMDVTFN
jgi:hypothetical protein